MRRRLEKMITTGKLNDKRDGGRPREKYCEESNAITHKKISTTDLMENILRDQRMITNVCLLRIIIMRNGLCSSLQHAKLFYIYKSIKLCSLRFLNFVSGLRFCLISIPDGIFIRA